MTWNDLADHISKMDAMNRKQEVRLVSDLDGPDQEVQAIKLSNAQKDIWHGFGIGCDLTFVKGSPYFELRRASEDD